MKPAAEAGRKRWIVTRIREGAPGAMSSVGHS